MDDLLGGSCPGGPSSLVVPAVGVYVDLGATNSETCAVRNNGVVRCFAQARVTLGCIDRGDWRPTRIPAVLHGRLEKIC